MHRPMSGRAVYSIDEDVIKGGHLAAEESDEEDPEAKSEVVHRLHCNDLTDDQPGIPFLTAKSTHGATEKEQASGHV